MDQQYKTSVIDKINAYSIYYDDIQKNVQNRMYRKNGHQNII